MKKVLICASYGGFGFSDEFINHMKQFPQYNKDLSRDDQFLVEQAEQFGLKKASGFLCELEIQHIPDGVEYSIHEYDGYEHINEIYIYVTMHELRNGLPKEKIELIDKYKCNVRIR